jgi:hypothetical protein
MSAGKSSKKRKMKLCEASYSINIQSMTALCRRYAKAAAKGGGNLPLQR